MKISEFLKLEKKINNNNFGESYKNINMLLVILSYFGNIASIFLAYFFMTGVISIAFTNSPIIVFCISLILLSGVELLKRDIFGKFSTQYVKYKNIKKEVLPLFIFSFLLIIASFYSSLSGAKEFSSKEKEITNTTNIKIEKYTDSLTSIYIDKIKVYETDISNYKLKLDEKDNEQSIINRSLQDVGTITNAQRVRNNQLSDEKIYLDNQINTTNDMIISLKQEKDSIINAYSINLNKISNEHKKDNSKNSLIFIIISTLIEFIILIGVFFGEYYKNRTYMEFKSNLDNDINFQTWKLYDSILKTIYPIDLQNNLILPKNKTMIEMCKLNNIRLLPKDMTIFLKLIDSIGIIKTTNSGRYISKQRNLAIDALKKYFNID